MNQEELKSWVEYFNRQEGRAYPYSNQIVLCAIITEDRDKALSIMEQKGATLKRLFYDHIEWELNNERWRWMNWNMRCRGYRFYKMVVDKDIDENIFKYVALPCAGSYCCSMEII